MPYIHNHGNYSEGGYERILLLLICSVNLKLFLKSLLIEKQDQHVLSVEKCRTIKNKGKKTNQKATKVKLDNIVVVKQGKSVNDGMKLKNSKYSEEGDREKKRECFKGQVGRMTDKWRQVGSSRFLEKMISSDHQHTIIILEINTHRYYRYST